MDHLLLNILLIVSIIALLLMVGFAVPCLLQIRRTALSLSDSLRTLNQSLPGILKNLEEMTGHLNRTATTFDRQLESVSSSIRKVQGTLGLLIGLEGIFRRSVPLPLMKILSLSLAVVKGVRVFVEHLRAEHSEKKGERSAEVK